MKCLPVVSPFNESLSNEVLVYRRGSSIQFLRLFCVTSLFDANFFLSFMFVIQYIMPLCVVVSFIYSVAILVQSIVYEKEQRLKEVMKMMGLSNAVHWTAWFITSMVVMMTIVVLLTTVLKVRSLYLWFNVVFIFTCWFPNIIQPLSQFAGNTKALTYFCGFHHTNFFSVFVRC